MSKMEGKREKKKKKRMIIIYKEELSRSGATISDSVRLIFAVGTMLEHEGRPSEFIGRIILQQKPINYAHPSDFSSNESLCE